jgi:hypothetical protein
VVISDYLIEFVRIFSRISNSLDSAELNQNQADSTKIKMPSDSDSPRDARDSSSIGIIDARDFILLLFCFVVLASAITSRMPPLSLRAQRNLNQYELINTEKSESKGPLGFHSKYSKVQSELKSVLPVAISTLLLVAFAVTRAISNFPLSTVEISASLKKAKWVEKKEGSQSLQREDNRAENPSANRLRRSLLSARQLSEVPSNAANTKNNAPNSNSSASAGRKSPPKVFVGIKSSPATKYTERREKWRIGECGKIMRGGTKTSADNPADAANSPKVPKPRTFAQLIKDAHLSKSTNAFRAPGLPEV